MTIYAVKYINLPLVIVFVVVAVVVFLNRYRTSSCLVLILREIKKALVTRTVIIYAPYALCICMYTICCRTQYLSHECGCTERCCHWASAK